MKGGDLQLQQMILIGVEINRMDTSRVRSKQVIEDIVPRRGNAEYSVIATDLEKAVVYARIFPSERIDIFVVETSMLLELVIVVDTSLAVLVEY